jgi:serine/threonine protein kinase
MFRVENPPGRSKPMTDSDTPDDQETQGSERPSEPADATAAYRPDVAGEELVRVLDQYLADLERGQAPSREKLLAEHPSLASQLEPCLSGIEFIHRAARPTGDAPSRLGDFEIVGEVGRGGMGVVYEARQISLDRKVALKVLRFGGVADRDAMERFQREAKTVAQLHHTNIVPIFAIGEQKGVFYYAMQFIEGRSLAAVLEHSQKEASSLNFVEAARWALQAAEALAYAHQRGVIHRDVKPSNLILDPAGQVWLTDFGLAKRMDDATLSITGALLGTPRYMSPEQASAAKQPVDQRTDIYSLGATLYELATGRPLFEADSPQGIISQILTTEPQPPRKVRSGLPRDMETIILKCLAKESQSRYATAQAMADDLRAFCEGRAIKARRARLPERAARWARKNRHSLKLAVSSVAIGMLLVGIGIKLSLQHYHAQLGHIRLKTDGPSLVADVLEADEDRPIMPSFTVPTAEPFDLPEGSYRLRLSGPGRATETTQLLVDRGRQLDYQVGLKQQLLWDPVRLGAADTARVVNLKPSGWFHVIRSDNWRSLSLLNGYDGKPSWTWGATGDLAGRSLQYNRDQDPPALVQPVPDIEHSGVGAVVWACRSSAALWALSGSAFGPTGADIQAQGKELWWFSRGPGETLGVPAVADVDGDGTPDFIATFASSGEVWIEAVSGKTGKSLWRTPLEGKWDHDAARSRFAAEVVPLKGRRTVICAAGSRLIGLELKTGKAAWPAFDLGIEPFVRPQIADLDHDGVPDVLIVGLNPPDTLSVFAVSLATQKPIWKKTLHAQLSSDSWAWAGDRGRSLGELRAWQWIADLGGDGKPAVIVPIVPESGGNIYRRWGGVEVLDGATGKSQWRHRLKLDTNALCCDRILVGPDIDGDGCRDLFAATTAPYQWHRAVFVDALSGKDGRCLWWWHSEPTGLGSSSGGDSISGNGFSTYISQSPYFRATSLRLWSAGRDGWPQLVVPYNGNETAVLSAGSGRLAQKIADCGLLQPADLDQDGIDDLVFRSSWPDTSALYAIHGSPPEMWRRLGDWQPAEDFDGDGVPDLINSAAWYGSPSGMTAISGRDGHVLWRSSEAPREHVALPPGHNDLDGDGTPDFLAVSGRGGGSQSTIVGTSAGVRFPIDLQAISGKTGKRLWSAEDVVVPPDEGQTSALVGWNPLVVTCRDFGGDGDCRVQILYELFSGSPRTSQLWLAELSARDGKTLWRQQLSERRQGDQLSSDMTIQPSYYDVDGDGLLDMVVALPVPPDKSSPGMWSAELVAVSGRDGKQLWRRPLNVKAESYNVKCSASAPAIGRLGGVGDPQVVILTQGWQKPQGKDAVVGEVQSFNARTGEPIWTYQPKFLNSRFFGPHVELVDLNGDGRLSAYASVSNSYNYSSFAITRIAHPDDGVALDSHGKLLPPPELPIAASYDLAGDGKQELLLLGSVKNTSTLRVVCGSAKTILWERSQVTAVREILPGKSGQPAVVVVTAAEGILGLDGMTGRPLWRCPDRAAGAFLWPPEPHEPPWLISPADGSTVCRRALATMASGEYAAAVGVPLADAPLPDDPRIVRSLPWVTQVSADRYGPGGTHFPPMWIATWVFLASLLMDVVRRRWRSLAVWLGVFLLASMAVTIVMLWNDAGAMDPMESYTRSGWYQVAYFGMPVAGALVALRLIVRPAWRLVRGGIRLIQPRCP